MELILALVGAGPMGFFASTPRRGLLLYLVAWAIVFPVQTFVVFSDGDGELSYWGVNAVILGAGICLNRLGARLARRRCGVAAAARGGVGLLAIGFAALAVSGPQEAHAGVALNTIDRHVSLAQDGALARASGPIACTRGERVEIAVRVRQAATSARGAGTWRARCTGEVQRWRVRARGRGEARFAAGKARVCAVAKTRAGGRVTDTREWCRRVSAAAAAGVDRPSR